MVPWGGLWERQACQEVQWGASECGLVEGLELGLGPLSGWLPTSLPQATTADLRRSIGRHGAACRRDWDTHLGQGKAGQGGQQGLARVQACPQR